jgi:hypothetical protein
LDENPDRTERARLREILESDLRRFAPDLEVVDRGLILSRGAVRTPNARRADLVFTDGAGSALLALVVDGRRDETVQAAVEALLFARENAGALARLRPSGTAPTGIGSVAPTARVAIVAEGYSERCLEALGLFPKDELWILEARRFEGETGARHVLVSLTPPPAMRERGERERLAFLARVPDPLRDAAEGLLRRLERLDRGARASFADGRATVRSGLREIVALAIQDGRLEAEAAALDETRPIRTPADAESFLDAVVRGELRGPPPVFQEGPLLTPEEIAAFRE